jgi:hypothetical protein
MDAHYAVDQTIVRDAKVAVDLGLESACGLVVAHFDAVGGSLLGEGDGRSLNEAGFP